MNKTNPKSQPKNTSISIYCVCQMPQRLNGCCLLCGKELYSSSPRDVNESEQASDWEKNFNNEFYIFTQPYDTEFTLSYEEHHSKMSGNTAYIGKRLKSFISKTIASERAAERKLVIEEIEDWWIKREPEVHIIAAASTFALMQELAAKLKGKDV